MSFINWGVATAEDLATLNVQLIKTELQRRSLSTTGNKEELIDRLLVDTAKEPQPNHEPAPCVPAISTSFPTVPVLTMSFPAMPTFTSDPAENMQRMAAFLHQNMALMMTTIASHANSVHGDNFWAIWKAGLQEQFGEQLSIIQWQQKVTALTQKAGESLQQYTFAKLKIMSRCPIPITDKERIEYLVQGIRDDQRPRTVDDFLNVVSEVDRALDHARLIRSPQSTEQDSRTTSLFTTPLNL
ncbi:hypothetical protein HPB50_013423 [Hyalomma asiaticum]|uniref:Uncharacterized protein n=1 Tax=Hyalomma asiaticum TaxID=266040 RepID=A0ACB7RM01_HYAAI|nr:hypothetical protein HPB50_013423 [Hyalomma asiaticum]